MVSGAAWETLSLVPDTVSVQASFICQSKLESVLGGAEGDLTFGHGGVVLVKRNSAARAVHAVRNIAADKVLKVLDRVNSSVALFLLHEASEGPNWLWLGSVSHGVTHFC